MWVGVFVPRAWDWEIWSWKTGEGIASGDVGAILTRVNLAAGVVITAAVAAGVTARRRGTTRHAMRSSRLVRQ